MKEGISDINEAARVILEKLQGWGYDIIEMLPNLLLAIVIIVGFAILARLIRKLLVKLLDKISSHHAINALIGSLLHVVIVIVGIFIALGVLQLDKTVTSLLAGAGIIGLAVSFAFQDTFANFIAGVILAMRRPIRVGDLVEIKDYFGIVEQISLRATLVRTLQGQIIIIPNKDVLQNPIENFSYTGERRIDLEVGISYGDDLEKVKQVTLAAVKKIEYLKAGKPIDLYYQEFGSSSINFVIRYWVDFSTQIDYLQALSDGIMNIKKAFDENDITIPFPIRTLDFGIKGGERLVEVLKERSLEI